LLPCRPPLLSLPLPPPPPSPAMMARGPSLAAPQLSAHRCLSLDLASSSGEGRRSLGKRRRRPKAVRWHELGLEIDGTH
ncbi:Os12g0107300, partial [Oryza sativa Japonica Group]